MANLGVQAGSGLDASDITTGTLGNTVQDNITRLGTVTTGTMKNTIHSDATFPAHHIVQVAYQETSNDANGTGDVLAVSKTITMSSATNKLLAFGNIHLEVRSTETDAYAGSKIVTSGTGVTAETFKMSRHDASGNYLIRFHGASFASGTDFFGMPVPINYLFSPAHAGDVTVSVYAMGYIHLSNEYGKCYVNGGTGYSNLLLMEVVA